MSGGNRAYTLQDVIGQLNTDSAQGQTADTNVQINVLVAVPDVVTLADTATVATGPTSGTFAVPITSSPSLFSSPSVISGATTGGFLWGTVPWS